MVVAVPNKRRQKKDHVRICNDQEMVPAKQLRMEPPVNDQEQPVVEKDTANHSRSTNF
ncbi:4575_t:CDS:2 [Funneliformis geosporum]|uniref:4575_t:CDS:1 n=1 Tax=Funneliformis geosporum TaxID=1117311 RepID=A0A9W4WR90_9GLOM|nr:4575_t:CDS:2 [Funneliformis geosporum]